MKELAAKELVPGRVWISEMWRALISASGAGGPNSTVLMVSHRVKPATKAPDPTSSSVLPPFVPDPR
jgi:hypothetical protein